jgi:hypothetical protein
MKTTTCPECGHPTTAEISTCANCGHALKNGTVQRLQGPVQKPPPPPEVAEWNIEKVPPEMVEEALRTFDEKEWQANVREIEKTGGLQFEDFISEIEEIVKRRD